MVAMGPVALLVVDVFAQARRPLRAVHVEAEEVRCRVDVGGLLGARDAVDERHLRLGLGVVLDGDPLGAGQRTDDDVDLVLLHHLAGGADGGVGARVGGADDHLDVAATGLACELLQRDLESADPVLAENGIRARQRGQEPDLQRLRGGCGAGAAERERQSESCRGNLVFPHWFLSFKSVICCLLSPHAAPPGVARTELADRRPMGATSHDARQCVQPRTAPPPCRPSPCRPVTRQTLPAIGIAMIEIRASGFRRRPRHIPHR